MKKNTPSYLLFAVSLFVMISCVKKPTTMKIFFSSDVDYVLLSNPELSICFEGFVDTFFVESLNKLELQLNLKEDRFFVMEIPERKKKWILPIQAGVDYKISIEENNSLTITGLNEQGILQYQSALNYLPGQLDWSIFKNDSMQREEIIDKLKQDELDVFRTLLSEKKITPQFFKLIQNDRDCFYAFTSAWTDLRDVMTIVRKENIVQNELKKTQLKESLSTLFEKYNPNNVSNIKSPTWFNYAIFMYIQVYTQFLNNKMNVNNIEDLFSEKHIPFWFEQIKKTFSGRPLEGALSTFLYQQGGSDGYNESEACISVYKFFKEKYPNSPYLKYFQKHMDNTVSFYEEKATDSSIHIIESDTIHTFFELISLFKGEKVYVDVWALWCNPCLAEFQNKDLLETILEKENITPLYIVLAEIQDEKRWRATININRLKGYHFLANKKFQEDLRRIYSEEDPNANKKDEGEKVFSIPWYLLIDENGKIIERHCKRPSEIISERGL